MKVWTVIGRSIMTIQIIINNVNPVVSWLFGDLISNIKVNEFLSEMLMKPRTGSMRKIKCCHLMTMERILPVLMLCYENTRLWKEI